MVKSEFPVIEIMQLPLCALQLADVVTHIADAVITGEGGWVVTPNLDILRRWSREAAFRELVAEATLFTPDGAPLVWASHLQGTPLPERVAGSDLFTALCKCAAERGISVAFIGGNPGVADLAKGRLQQLHPGLNVVATLCPPLGFESSQEEMQRITEFVASNPAQIYFVGLGSPKQEQLIGQLKSLSAQSWWLGVGVSFSFVADDVRRAPHWMRRFGLEWLHRLVQEPKRLARRYLVDGIPFLIELLASSLLQRVKRS